MTRNDIETCGGKAATLLELQAAGFPVPPFVVSPACMRDAVAELGFPLAVRSSASAEDGRELSFAGQFYSELHLNSIEDVELAVQRCRDSVESPAVGEYCRRNGISPRSLRMDVIVQQMIQPELSGVAFTVNPVTGAEEVVIEACRGVSENLLAGRTSALADDDPLLVRYRPTIEQMAKRLQLHFGMPQDVEFAIEDGELYVLQSRPITRIEFAPEIGEWTNADFRDGGVSSGVCTPLMWSLYEFIWDKALKNSLKELKLFGGDFQSGRMFFGRPYWNLGAVKRCVAKLPGFIERDFDRDLNVEINYEGDGMRTPVSFLRIVRAIPTLFALGKFFKRQVAFDRRFLETGFAAIERQHSPLRPDVETAFRELIERDFVETECNYFRTIFAASLAKMDFTSSFPDADYRMLVSALPPLRHMEPVRAVRSLSACDDENLDGIVEKYRHHYRRGLDICFRRWDEDDVFVQRMLRSLPSHESENGRTESDIRADYERAKANALTKLPRWQRRSFLRKLERLREFVWLREEMRDLSSRMYYLIRRYALEIARKRGIGDDIFFMTFREIFTRKPIHVKRSREIYESYRHFQAPNEIGRRYGLNSARVEANDCHGSHILTGIGASAGTVTGKAFIASSVAEAIHIPPGSILVCPFTDPGWTPILDRAAGVVTEAGGLLSHAAIICREFGIAAILGVPHATTRIATGDTLRLRGDDGHVEIVERNPIESPNVEHQEKLR